MASPQRVIIAPSSPPATPPDPRLGTVPHSLHHHYSMHRDRSHPTNTSRARAIVQRTSFTVRPSGHHRQKSPRPPAPPSSTPATGGGGMFRFDEDLAISSYSTPAAITTTTTTTSTPGTPTSRSYGGMHGTNSARRNESGSLRTCYSTPTLSSPNDTNVAISPPERPRQQSSVATKGLVKSAPIVIPMRESRAERSLPRRRPPAPPPPPPRSRRKHGSESERHGQNGLGCSFSSSSSDSDFGR